MDTSIVNMPSAEIIGPDQITVENRLEIIDEGIRKKYLARLSEMAIAPIDNLPLLEEDLINNVRLFRITEMVYQRENRLQINLRRSLIRWQHIMLRYLF